MNERIEKLKKQSKKNMYIALGTVISAGSAWYGLRTQSTEVASQISKSGLVSEDLAQEAMWTMFSKFEPIFIVLFFVSFLWFIAAFKTYLKDRNA
jgi:hypothetical protein